ncbi:MAG: hypothetical protein E7544_07660 [Ruminococcaceae bacterium]|nr:hypothetical protein [Oscillospiraceae bacterium]
MTLNVIPKPNKVSYYGGTLNSDEVGIAYLTDEKLSDEGYVISIQQSGITITSKSEKGKFYADKTLSQILRQGSVPLCRIEDEPAFPYRGFMIDSVRHMQSVEEIKKYISAAAELKFNTFHWHLSDDQGWRIEVECFPELMEKGAWRDCHGFGSKDGRAYGGYYTKDEIRDVIAFCKERYIDVIPEIDMPGHTTAIVSTFPELSCRGEHVAVKTEGGIFRDILCAGNEAVYDFCYRLLDEIAELFPYEYFHIGGDEAPKSRWVNCPKCQTKIKAEGLSDVEQLQGYFTNKIAEFLESKGKKIIAWNETLNSGIAKNSITICDWMDRDGKCVDYANNGGKVIAEDFYHYYLDYVYGVTPLKKTYCYKPVYDKLTEENKKNVIGVEAPVWTEYIEDFDRMCYMCFPRLLAVGEAGWTREENKDYESFKKRLVAYEKPLSDIGIKMAAAQEWDPGFKTRSKDVFKRIKDSLTPEAIRVTLFPNKE